MKKYILIILLLLITTISISQSIKDTVYVLNYNGTELFEKPAFDSEVLEKPKLNSSLILLKDIPEIKISKTISKVKFEGHWQEVKFNNKTGFVFSGDCSKHKCLTENKFGGYDIDYKNLFGKKISSKKAERIIEIKGEKITVIDEIDLYERGQYIYTPFDGCFDHTHVFRSISFNEVFHIMMAIHTWKMETIDGIIFDKPKLKNSDKEIYKFTGTELTREIWIIIKENSIELYSYDCT